MTRDFKRGDTWTREEMRAIGPILNDILGHMALVVNTCVEPGDRDEACLMVAALIIKRHAKRHGRTLDSLWVQLRENIEAAQRAAAMT
jgi:hypothetical protein